MKEYKIDQNSEEQRLDRFLVKLMPDAGKNFLQKMLRKKRIKLNNNRADPKALIHFGDTIQIYFSDETISGFRKETLCADIPHDYLPLFEYPIFENSDILVVDKPAGLLSQPDSSGELSLADLAVSYLGISSETPDSLSFRPALSNRLDRNTSGVVMIPKHYAALKTVNAAIRKRETIKEYRTIVKGKINAAGELHHHLLKDNQHNIVHLSDHSSDDSKAVHLRYTPIDSNDDYTLLHVLLLTGRTHQIRSQLSAAGHPVIGDEKYGDAALNRFLRQHYGLSHQLLHSFHYAIPHLGYDFTAPYPPLFLNCLNSFRLKGGF